MATKKKAKNTKQLRGGKKLEAQKSLKKTVDMSTP
jgi:hypothetical protein